LSTSKSSNSLANYYCHVIEAYACVIDAFCIDQASTSITNLIPKTYVLLMFLQKRTKNFAVQNRDVG